jgi:hypothetical protein
MGTIAELSACTDYMQYQRILRGLQHPIYLLHFSIADKELKLAGTTKNVYTVKYDPVLACDCPDGKIVGRGGPFLCKHVCFVICKIGKFYDQEIFETFKLSSEQGPLLEQKLMQVWNGDEGIIDMLLVDRFQKMELAGHGSDGDPPGRLLSDEDECPICYDKLKGTSITACNECGNYVHDRCLERWLAIKSTCVYCRSFLRKQSGGEYLQL